MDERTEVARRFGELVTELARQAGYDPEPGAGGRASLARDLGINPSMVSRALDGKVLPQPHQFGDWARVLNVSVRTLMVESRVISPEDWPEGAVPDVLSVTTRPQPITPEAAADAWQITNPMLRRTLIAHINQTRALQAEENQHGADGGAVARG